MNEHEEALILDKIESEGFNYAIIEYGGKIEDPEFQRLRRAYLEAELALAKYIDISL